MITKNFKHLSLVFLSQRTSPKRHSFAASFSPFHKVHRSEGSKRGVIIASASPTFYGILKLSWQNRRMRHDAAFSCSSFSFLSSLSSSSLVPIAIGTLVLVKRKDIRQNLVGGLSFSPARLSYRSFSLESLNILSHAFAELTYIPLDTYILLNHFSYFQSKGIIELGINTYL